MNDKEKVEAAQKTAKNILKVLTNSAKIQTAIRELLFPVLVENITLLEKVGGYLKSKPNLDQMEQEIVTEIASLMLRMSKVLKDDSWKIN